MAYKNFFPKYKVAIFYLEGYNHLMKTNRWKNITLMPDSVYRNGNWKHYNMKAHTHGILEFNYILDGSCHYLVDGKKFELNKKNLLIIDASVEHQKIFDHTIPCTVIGFSLDHQVLDFPCADFDYLLQSNPPLKQLMEDLQGALIIQDAQKIKEDIENLFDEFSHDKNTFSLYSLANRLLLEIGRLYKQKNAGTDSYMRQIRDYVQCNYHRIQNIQEISDVVSLHPTYLERIFKKESGQTLWKYVNDYRLQTAANLLSYTDVPIGQIDELIGMNSRQAFYIRFKEKYKMSPLEYRRNTT